MQQDSTKSLSERHQFTGRVVTSNHVNERQADVVRARQLSERALRYCAIDECGVAGCAVVLAINELDQLLADGREQHPQSAQAAQVRLEVAADLGDEFLRSILRDACQLLEGVSPNEEGSA